MSVKMRIHGFDKLEYSTCGADGGLGAVDTELLAIVPDSTKYGIEKPEDIEIPIEGSDEPDIRDILRGGLKTVHIKSYDTNAANLVSFFGGSATEIAPFVYTAPIKSAKIFMSIQVTCKYVEGHATVLKIPKVLVLASLVGAISDKESGYIDLEFKVASPISALGVALAPFTITNLVEV